MDEFETDGRYRQKEDAAGKAEESAKAWEDAWKRAECEQDKRETAAKQKEKFTWNRKYLTICLYAIIVVLASVIIIKAIMDWKTTKAYINELFSVVSPFIWGAFIAFLINPFVRLLDRGIFGRIKWIKRKDKIRKALSLVFAYLFVLAVVVLACIYLLPQIGNSIAEIFGQIPKWIEEISAWIMKFEEEHPDFNYVKINEYLNSFTPQLLDLSKNVVTNVLPLIFTTSVSVVKVVLNMLIAFMVSIYIISDRRLLINGFKKVLYATAPVKTGDFVMKTLRECYHIFSQFVFGKAIDSLIIGMICFIAMTILQLPFTPLISLIVGVTNMIPYFGPFIGAVPGAILIFMVSPLKALIFVVMIIILQQFDGLYLGPRILGETVGLRPLWIIFAITIGGSMAGVAGMFLGVPVVAVVAYLAGQLLERLIAKKNVDVDEKIR